MARGGLDDPLHYRMRSLGDSVTGRPQHRQAIDEHFKLNEIDNIQLQGFSKKKRGPFLKML